MPIATFQNHQLALQGSPFEKGAIHSQIVQWLDLRGEFQLTKLQILARELSEVALRSLQNYVERVTKAKLLELKRNCQREQSKHKLDKLTLFHIFGKGIGAVSGSTYPILAALNSARLIAKAAAVTNGALSIYLSGFSCYHRYYVATATKEKRAIKRRAEDDQSKVRRVCERINGAIDALIVEKSKSSSNSSPFAHRSASKNPIKSSNQKTHLHKSIVEKTSQFCSDKSVLEVSRSWNESFRFTRVKILLGKNQNLPRNLHQKFPNISQILCQDPTLSQLKRIQKWLLHPNTQIHVTNSWSILHSDLQQRCLEDTLKILGLLIFPAKIP